MMEKIKELFNQYSEQIITWYNGLEELYQYGVFFLVIVGCLLIFAYFMLSRITK
jgi:hypothetical protein